jgi:hypothetical protein
MRSLPDALAPLAAYRQFILYKTVPSAVRPGRTDKLPCDWQTGQVVTAHDPRYWTEASTAIAAATANPGYGVGFVFTETDPFWFVDIDGAYDGVAWSPVAQQLCTMFAGAAVEISTSGKGLHLFGAGTVPPHGTRLKALGLEFYTSGRFVALTGDQARGSAATDFTPLMPSFVAQWFPPGAGEHAPSVEWSTEPVPEWRGPTDDDDLIRRAIHSSSLSALQGRASFADLWQCNVDVLAATYPPDPNSSDAFGASEADSSLASHLLFWTGKDCERTRQIMQRSALVRDKWQREDYLERTILRAAGVVAKVCQNKEKTLPSLAVGGDPVDKFGPVIFANELERFFKNCVYVQDNHAILLPTGDMVDQQRFNAAYPGKLFCMDGQNERTSKLAWDAYLQNSVVLLPHVQGTCFRPDLPFQSIVAEASRTWVNVYRKPEVVRGAGDVGPYIQLLKKMLPVGDDWLILDAFTKAIVQYPGVKFDWTIFLQGTPGNGKSTILQCLRYALGRRYIFNIKPHMIDGNFNGWMENNVLYVGDDVYTYTDRAGIFEALKSMITEREHAVTYKGIDSVQKNICGNFFFMDNHRNGLHKTPEDRRICPLFCAQQTKEQRDADGLTAHWFATVYYPWLEAEGYRYVAHYLHTGAIDPRFNPAGACGEAPATSSTQIAIESSMTLLEEDITELIETRAPGFCGGFISATMLKRASEKKVSRLKVKEALERLGYDSAGRTGRDVTPDSTRSIIYVKRGTVVVDLAAEYEAAQLKGSFPGRPLVGW